MKIAISITTDAAPRKLQTDLFGWYYYTRCAMWPVIPGLDVIRSVAKEGKQVVVSPTPSWTPFEVSENNYNEFVRAASSNVVRCHFRHEVSFPELRFPNVQYTARTAPEWVNDWVGFFGWMKELLFGTPGLEFLELERACAAAPMPQGLISPSSLPPAHIKLRDFLYKYRCIVTRDDEVRSRPESTAGHSFARGDVVHHEYLGIGRVQGFVVEHDLHKVVVRFDSNPRQRFKPLPNVLKLDRSGQDSTLEPDWTVKPIQYVRGDATRPQATPPIIIAHICNDKGGWGKGFVLALSQRWPKCEESYREWHKLGPRYNFQLGQVDFVGVETDLYVANMLAQRGYRRTKAGPPLRYDSLRQCLREVATKARSLAASVHMPRIGTGLAGGTWDKVEPIIQETLSDAGIHVTVYDL